MPAGSLCDQNAGVSSRRRLVEVVHKGRRRLQSVNEAGEELQVGMKGFGTNTKGAQDGNETATLEEIGKQFGVTHERVRQLQNATLAKLRHKIDELEKASQ